jgi:SM-20-related protein
VPAPVDLLVLPAFIDDAERERLLKELRKTGAAPAGVYGTAIGAAVHPNVRSASRLVVSAGMGDILRTRFESARPELERHFGVMLRSCEDPQFLRYQSGDFFVAHQDGNTPLTRDESRDRRVSVVLFLNEQSAEEAAGKYGGGDLLFHGAYPDWQTRHRAPATPGTLIAFRAETTHEVTPVTHGDRYTVVTWYR